MKNISLIKSLEISNKFKSNWFIISPKDVVILYSLIDIYNKWLKWELWDTTEIVHNENNDYIFIKKTNKLIEIYYPEIKEIRSTSKFRLWYFSNIWLIDRINLGKKNESYFKPKEVLYKYLK